MNIQAKNAVDLLLAESLKELAQTKPLEKVTIKDITDKAGVIRPTFYNHFQDKYELMEYIIRTQLLEPVEPLIHAGLITETMVLLLTNVEKEKVFYSKAVRMEGTITFTTVAEKCVKELLLKIIDEKLEGKKRKGGWITPDMIATYYAQSMVYAASEWIRMGMPSPAREVAEAYNFILTNSMGDVIDAL